MRLWRNFVKWWKVFKCRWAGHDFTSTAGRRYSDIVCTKCGSPWRIE